MKAVVPLFLALLCAGCASFSREDQAATPGSYLVSAPRTLFAPETMRGSGDSFISRDVVLEKDAPVELLRSEGARAVVRIADGRLGYVFLKDIQPVPVPEVPSVSSLREDLRTSHHTPSLDEAKPEPPSPPVNRKLIEESNNLDLPEVTPLLSPPAE